MCQVYYYQLMYTVQNFRYTQQGWIADAVTDGAIEPHSLPLDTVNAAECRNFEQAYIVAACLPFEPMYGCWVDVVQSEPATVTEKTEAVYMQADLGTRFIVSGGEVLELDSQAEGGDEYPF